ARWSLTASASTCGLRNTCTASANETPRPGRLLDENLPRRRRGQRSPTASIVVREILSRPTMSQAIRRNALHNRAVADLESDSVRHYPAFRLGILEGPKLSDRTQRDQVEARERFLAAIVSQVAEELVLTVVIACRDATILNVPAGVADRQGPVETQA